MERADRNENVAPETGHMHSTKQVKTSECIDKCGTTICTKQVLIPTQWSMNERMRWQAEGKVNNFVFVKYLMSQHKHLKGTANAYIQSSSFRLHIPGPGAAVGPTTGSAVGAFAV